MELQNNGEQLNKIKPTTQKKVAMVMAVFFMVILLLPTLIWGAMGIFCPNVLQSLKVDTNENRQMTTFPTDFNVNTFPQDIESWYNDNLPFRSLLYLSQSKIKQSIENLYLDGLLPWFVSSMDGRYPIIYNNASKNVVYGKNNWLFYGAEGSLDYYMATNLLTEQAMLNYALVLSQLQALCDARGIKLVLMFHPNKEQVYFEHMPTLKVETEYKRTERLVDYLKTNTPCNVVFTKQNLVSAKQLGQTYYRYDTHWNNLGSYIGVQALYSALQMETTPWQNLSPTQIIVNNGDLLNMGDIDKSKYVTDIDYNVIYKPTVLPTYTQGEVAVGHNVSETLHSTAQCGNDNNFVLIGDSFRLSMVKYLQKDFTKTTITHRNHLETTDVKNAILNTDILVLSCVERYDVALFEDALKIINILNNG